MAEKQETVTNPVPVDSDNKNKQKIVCERCASVIMLPGLAKYTKKEVYNCIVIRINIFRITLSLVC